MIPSITRLHLVELAPALLPFGLVVGVGLDGGGYAATAWGWSTVAPLALVLVALATGIARSPGLLARLFLTLIVAFAGWTLLSVAWSRDVSQSMLDAERTIVYVGSAAAFLIVGRRHAPRFVAGLLSGIAVLCAWALGERALGGSGAYDVGSGAPEAARRLAAPLGYSNSLGLVAAVGALLGAGLAFRARTPRGRGTATATLLLTLPTLFFTYSRGAWLALAIGAVTAVAASRPRVPRPVAVGAAVAVVGAVAVALVHVGGPVGAYHAFSRSGPTVKANESSRLLTLSGSSRAQYWHAAWTDYTRRPLLGSGAGSFQRWWLAHRPAALPVLDAHSLYLETLAELGPVGLALLVCALPLPLLAAIRARAEPLVAVVLGGYTAYLVHAAQDWDWELPAATLVAIACGVALLVLAERDREPLGARSRALAAAVAALVALAALGALVGNAKLASAARDLDESHLRGAASIARSAEGWVPWSAAPWRLLGEAQLAEGNVDGAGATFREAVRKDGGDWESWLDLALATRGAERRAALDHVRRLNPLAPELAQVSSSGR